MARLGYDRYGAQGGDWGAHILRQLGQIDQVHLIGIHSNMCRALQPPATTEPYEGVPAEERRLIAETPPFRSALSREGGYGEIQRTRPQTLAYGPQRLTGRASGLDPREVADVVGFRWRSGEALHKG